MCISVLTACMCAIYVSGALGGQRRASDTVELEWQLDVGAGNWTWVLCKYSYPWSQLSSPSEVKFNYESSHFSKSICLILRALLKLDDIICSSVYKDQKSCNSSMWQGLVGDPLLIPPHCTTPLLPQDLKVDFMAIDFLTCRPRVWAPLSQMYSSYR